MEEHKHKCAVRQLLKWRQEWGKDKFKKYLIKHSFEKKITDDVYEQWLLGNRGEEKCWKDTLSQQQGLDI